MPRNTMTAEEARKLLEEIRRFRKKHGGTINEPHAAIRSATIPRCRD